MLTEKQHGVPPRLIHTGTVSSRDSDLIPPKIYVTQTNRGVGLPTELTVFIVFLCVCESTFNKH